jgi:hypothetical protein
MAGIKVLVTGNTRTHGPLSQLFCRVKSML